ncbi:hypothetical protein GDO81_010706 [Engystomops pustulosus]|uniref:SH2 domain-containing protein n=1 Tax=Engystomops pustulosus TaxID=76066 RepID=A0AAV7C272_ENGPU|nr:hypothetical protein GDO81_010706 [Engystomops pustulosus]
MDFRKVPSCTEVRSWSPEDLTDYFRVEMSENDMQKFPKTRVPMLIRIQQQIMKKEEKKGLFPLRSETQRGYATGSHDTSLSGSWDGMDSDSFDDDDYEDPDDQGNEDYEDPDEPAEDEDSGNSDGYELPPSNNDFLPVNPSKTISSNQDYIGRPVSVSSNSSKGPPDPPVRPAVPDFPSRSTFPGVQPPLSQESPKPPRTTKPFAPSVDRTTKPMMQAKPPHLPGKNLPGQPKAVTLPAHIRPLGKPEHLRKPALPSQSAVSKPGYPSQMLDADDIPSPDINDPRRLYPHNSNTFPSTSPKPSIRSIGSGSNTLPTTDISHSASPLQAPGGHPYPPFKPENRYSEGPPNGRPPAPIPVTNLPYNSKCGNDGIHSERWYLGDVSRGEAENALRSINKDGTFLVRNCSKSTLSQPYVLMVLYKNKVYNVRIRYDQNNEVYLLGSGGHETFDSVSEIIDYFRKSPLLLIDGKDRGSRQHCKLTWIADRSFN